MGKEVFTILSCTEDALVCDYTLEHGGFVPQHVHLYSNEIFEMTEGTLTMNLASETRELKAGEAYTVPMNSLHGIKNKSGKTIRCRVTYTPTADADKLMGAMQQLLEEYPEQVFKNQMRAFYIAKKLGWRDFSSPGNAGGRVAFAIIGFAASVGAALGGWNKLLPGFR
ncbi:MAG: hypothetical protein POELPBGB_03186 [Bacteroidia bacterium]|nr:hypothetical protein [Bacteroidia bacterium]